MTQLDPEARRILSLARSARTPTAEDQARVSRRLAAAAGVGAAASALTSTAQAKATLSIGSLKLWLTSGLLLTAAISATYLALPASAPLSQVPVPMPVHDPAPAPAPAIAPAPDLLPEAPAPPPRRQQLHALPTLPAELELLHSAQAAWRSGSPSRALELLTTHRQRYPRSQLRSERETLEVLALCELGQTRKATRLARNLLARDPHSPSRAAIEQSCGIE